MISKDKWVKIYIESGRYQWRHLLPSAEKQMPGHPPTMASVLLSYC